MSIAEVFDGIHLTNLTAVLAASESLNPRIGVVLSLDKDINMWPDTLIFRQFPIGKNPLSAETIKEAAAFIQFHRTQSKHILLQSEKHPFQLVILVLAYYMEYKKFTLPQAYATLTNDLVHCPLERADMETLNSLYNLNYTHAEIYDRYFSSKLLEKSRYMINHVHDHLYISSMYAIKNEEDVAAANIRAVLRLDELTWNKAMTWPEEKFFVLKLPILDGNPVSKELLELGVLFIARQRRLGQAVLVHCHMGISRSATFVIAYLMEQKKMSLPEAYYRTQTARPIIAPHKMLLFSLLKYYNLPYTYDDLEKPDFRQRLYEEGHKIVAGKTS